ncbi:unnamed protein product [Linum tenue]|uniref:Uncharacterized protein n=1 Tax=Linum tenue TaxID=586396 RepID=A0AAV0RUR7_9ROSI|nr:unnamed protein product [Linum tenue]
MSAEKDERRKAAAFIKLVHPKGIVERLTRPTRASEVMKRYPRHCVTRPDVFKNPWIAVHPDSLLKLGCVFYVVPYHTIDRLLKQHSTNLAAKGIYGLFHGDDRFRSARQAQIREIEGRLPIIGADSPQIWRPATALSYYKKDDESSEPVESRGDSSFSIDIDSFRRVCGGGGCGAELDCSSFSSSSGSKMLKPCLRKSSSRSGSRGPDSSRVKFTLPGEDDGNLRVEIFEFQRAV